MEPSLRRALWTTLAVVVVLVVFYAALSGRVYERTLPHGLIEHIFGENANEGPFSVSRLLRKFYSVVAFTLVGIVFDRALPPSRHPALRAALLVGMFSLAIEVVQKLRYAREGVLSNVFDIACGAFGGWLAVVIVRLLKAGR